MVIQEKIHTSPTEKISAIQGGGGENVLRCPKGGGLCRDVGLTLGAVGDVSLIYQAKCSKI